MTRLKKKKVTHPASLGGENRKGGFSPPENGVH
jgi:hypothetical protein